MTKLSVNINKIATLRNARGGNNPDVVKIAMDCERFGAQGITIHPRPDERHITSQDVFDLQKVVTTEYNIEGYPDRRFLSFIEQIRPHQATLVPDSPDAITSNAGWDTKNNAAFLTDVIQQIRAMDVRTSLFISTDLAMIEKAKEIDTDRIELYTEPYAIEYPNNPESAVNPFVIAANKAKELGLGINAGHDLDLNNLKFLKKSIPFLDEVSIGHALIADSLYYGLENTIQMYLRQLQ